VLRRDGSLERHRAVTALPLSSGDLIRIHTANGGGFGDPRQRARQRVCNDVRNGYVSAAEALEVYGVTPDMGVGSQTGVS
jgi:N-methylhydantoinase B